MIRDTLGGENLILSIYERKTPSSFESHQYVRFIDLSHIDIVLLGLYHPQITILLTEIIIPFRPSGL